MWKKELEQLEESSEVGGGSGSNGHSGKISDVTGNRAVRIIALCEQIDGTINELLSVIANETDPIMRQVLNYRWVHTGSERLTWRQISRKIYGTDEYWESLRRAYLRKYENG